MVTTFLIASFFVLAGLVLALYYWQKPGSVTESEPLALPPGRGLFIDGTPQGRALAQAHEESRLTADAAAMRLDLVGRAKTGEKSVLLETRNCADPTFYEDALSSLVASADSDPKLLSLVSYVTRHELRVNTKLAQRLVESYKRSPDRSSTATMLHIAALSDDATVYQTAVETVLMLWRDQRLTDTSAAELRSILEGEFWILSAPTRSSGAGFLLKRALTGARRELEAAHND